MTIYDKLLEMDGTPVYHMQGTIPFLTFTIYDAKSGVQAMQIKKNILHLLPHYSFYIDGEKVASMHRRVDLLHKSFAIRTKEGPLEMRNIVETFGANFRVSVKGRIIGTVAEKMNLTLDNIVYDNLVIYVREEKDRLLMTAMGIMVVREMARERASQQKDPD